MEEAGLVGDRVVVTSPRAGRVVAEGAIDLERPGGAVEPAVAAVRARLLEAMR